jgi:small subunit ribosomal protein S6
MAEKRTSNYEGLFLISQATATDLNAAVGFIRSAIEKNGGSVIAARKWDERRLAFEIDKQKRGYYLLFYFSAPTTSLSAIERAYNLSEVVMRQLIIKVEHMSLEDMKALDASGDLATEAKLRASQPAPVLANVVETEPVNDDDELL